MKRIDNIYDVVKRLCGFIDPVGDSAIDETRMLNLKDTLGLVDELIDDIIEVSKNADRHEHSMKEMGKLSHLYLVGLRDKLSEIAEYRIKNLRVGSSYVLFGTGMRTYDPVTVTIRKFVETGAICDINDVYPAQHVLVKYDIFELNGIDTSNVVKKV
jgi:hypothetical protein